MTLHFDRLKVTKLEIPGFDIIWKEDSHFQMKTEECRLHNYSTVQFLERVLHQCFFYRDLILAWWDRKN